MFYTSHYLSPLGDILLAADENGLAGLWFEGQKYFAQCLDGECSEKEVPVLILAKRWLDIYFSGREPGFSVPLSFHGTGFQNEVQKILISIPYGHTMTYGQVAQLLAKWRNPPRMPARAAAGAVARNNISVIVPCHRVIGADKSLKGYAGGIERKIALLKLEGVTRLYG